MAIPDTFKKMFKLENPHAVQQHSKLKVEALLIGCTSESTNQKSPKFKQVCQKPKNMI